MTNRYKRKVAWITGASSGIGMALAHHMVQKGWKIAISARRADVLHAVAQAASAAPGQLFPYVCDVTDEHAVRQTYQEIEQALGPVELVILNAGTHIPLTLERFNCADVARLLQLNFMGTVHCLDVALKTMRKHGDGHIALVSSLAGFRGLPTSSAYGASKAALRNMAEALQPEAKLAGVKIQIVCPGFVKTPLTAKNEFPMPFLMEPDMAARAFYRGLCSGRFEIVFPWKLGVLVRLLGLLPTRLYLGLMRYCIPEKR